MVVKAKGTPRVCHRKWKKMPKSLGYPLSVFNKNSSLKSVPEILKTTRTIEPGASGLSYYCNFICVRVGCTRFASCVDSKPKKIKKKQSFKKTGKKEFEQIETEASNCFGLDSG